MAKIKLGLKKFFRENPQEAWGLVIILIIGAFLRLYRIDAYMTFLGDEGRDVILVRRLLVEGDPILIGPGTSIGNMYLGPIYYYMMAPALLLARFSPVGPAVMVALLGVATIFLIYYIARKWFTPRAGLMAALLYALSPTVIVHARSSWNPNIMPLFALLAIYALWRVSQEKKYKWLIVLGVSFAVALQSHYLGILLLPVILLFVFPVLSERAVRRPLFLGFFAFFLLMSPLLFFDLRHNFMNFNALRAFLGEPQGNLSLNLIIFLSHFWANFQLIITRLLTGRNEVAGVFLSVFFVGVLVYRVFEKSLSHKHCQFLLAWLGFGLFGLSFLNREIYDHYLGFVFPAPFLFLAGLSEYLKERLGKFGSLFVFLGFAVLVLINLAQNPLKNHPNRQMQRSKVVAEKILEEAGGQKFNLAVLAERNYEDGYAYFLEREGVRPLHADRWNASTISDQLFVVCERLHEECKPTTDPKAEIVNFGMTKVEAEWEVGGIFLYKLVHKQ